MQQSGTLGDPVGRRDMFSSLEHYRLLVEHSVSAISVQQLVYDDQGEPVDWILVSANPAFERHTGKQRDELLGQRVRDLLPCANIEAFLRQYAEVVRSGVPVSWEEYSEPLQRYFTCSAFKVGDDLFATIFEDISERKITEKALQESELRFKKILQGVDTVAIQGYGMDGTVHYWNRASTTFYGYTEEEVLGRNLLDLIIPEEMSSIVKSEIARMAETRQAIPAAELRLRRKDGSMITVYSSHSYVEVPGREPEFFCIDIDLSERERAAEQLRETNRQLEKSMAQAKLLAQKAEAAAEAKAEFLANISHELLTPMNGVLGMADLLAQTDLDDEQQNYLGLLKSSATNLLSVIRALLDFSRVDSGKMSLVEEPLDLAQLLDQVSIRLAVQAAKKQLRFSCKRAPDLPAYVMGDARRLKQIISNLSDNAIKFTEEGEVSVSVEYVPDWMPPGQVQRAATADLVPLRFSVKDTGIGIVTEKMDRLFKDFSQVDGSITREHGGVGLGLAIARHLVELMGGEIGVESASGSGSTFWFTVPLTKQAERLRSESKAEPDASFRTGWTVDMYVNRFRDRSAHVLVAEDNPVNAEIILFLLKTLGLQAEVVDNGMDAVGAVQSGSYDAVLMDVQMPGMDGLTATREIRLWEQAVGTGVSIPIIAVTAHTQPDDRAICLEAGMDDYVAKPVTPEVLVPVLEKLLPVNG
jgi:PAS domain S-box-containing protein